MQTSRIELAFCDMPLTDDETKHFIVTGDRKNVKQQTKTYKTIQLTIRTHIRTITTPSNSQCLIYLQQISYGNGKRRVSTTSFEVKYYPDNTAILKRLLYRATARDTMLLNNNTIHFVVYGLPQNTSSNLYRSQIIRQNTFLYNINVVPIVNIDPDTMYNEIYPKISTLNLIKGLEEISLPIPMVNNYY